MSNRPRIIELTIRSEIEDWFKALINKRFGSVVQLQYLSNDEHFNIHTQIEVTASENQINDVIEFIGSTSELLQYKLPWLNGNIYYNDGKYEQSTIKEKLNEIMEETNYMTSAYQLIGCQLSLFHFRPDLDETDKMEIDKMFKTLPHTYSLFLTYPKMRVARSQSSFHLATNILMGYHGSYLKYLHLEDILSLEIANNGQETGADPHLHHDFQMFLRCIYPYLYDGMLILDLKEFKINEVLRYFIHKFHDSLKKIYISNILTADEIQSLTQSYNIEIVCNKLIHIDFKSANEPESVDFCLIYHFDPDDFYFLNYETKYASEKHAINFNVDDSLDPLKCSTDFSYLVIKSQNNCSPQKSKSVLKCVTEHFNASKNLPILVLHEFDLKHVSKPIISSLLKLMGQGSLEFHKMSFNFETLGGILTQSAKNSITFNKCEMALGNFKIIPINSQQSRFEFHDMDIDLNLLYMLNNLKYLNVVNCRILSTSCDVAIKMEISEYILFEYTNFDVTTIVRLLDGWQSAQTITFESCDLTSSDLVETRYLVLRNKIYFINMILKISDFLRIFEKWEVKNRLFFINCHLRHEDNESYKFLLEPVHIDFDNIKFDAPTLLTLLGSLNNESEVWVKNCCVSRSDDNFAVTKNIQARYVHFEKCRIETNILLKILGKISKNTLVIISCCHVMRSSVVDPTILTNLSEMRIHFLNMTIESQLVRPILRTNSEITFDNCCLTFMTDELSDAYGQSTVLFQNMKFQSPAQLGSLASFTPKSIMKIFNCHFEFTNLEIANIVIQPQLIHFKETSFDLEVLLKVMERVSEHTIVFIDRCAIRSIAPMLHTEQCKIKEVYFWNMSLQIKTILYILKNFSNLENLYFKNLKMLCSNPTELQDIKIKPSMLCFSDMNIDLPILQTLVHKCSKRLLVTVDNCTIISSSALQTRLNISRILFKNVNYSPEVLRLIQSLSINCTVLYTGQLSNQAIIEICTKSSVSGTRLILDDQNFSISFYYELFLEYFRPKALNFELDTNAEYDLPTAIIPRKSSVTDNTDWLVRRLLETKYWNEIKIKFVEVNDGTVRLEFLRHGKVIDLFFILNGLPDDSDECFVDYY